MEAIIKKDTLYVTLNNGERIEVEYSLSVEESSDLGILRVKTKRGSNSICGRILYDCMTPKIIQEVIWLIETTQTRREESERNLIFGNSCEEDISAKLYGQ